MKYLFTCLLIMLSLKPTFGQDQHFAQVEYAPLLLNPALAGANTRLQVIANYRTQWKSIAAPYQTIAASIDARLQGKYSDRNSFLAVGASFFNDIAGDMKMQTNQFNLDLAYHIKMGKYSVFRIGIYGGLNQRSIDINRAGWASQYDGSAINTSLGSGESFGALNHTFMDAGAGTVYTYRKMKYSVNSNVNNNVNAGIAFYHVNRPYSSFISKKSERLYMRFSTFVNGSFNLGRTPLALQPGLYVQVQAKYFEVMYGTYLRIALSEGSHFTGRGKSSALGIGIFNRYFDAFVLKSYLQYHNFSVGFSYDLNTSRLTPVSKARGGMEFFLRFILDDRINNPALW